MRRTLGGTRVVPGWNGWNESRVIYRLSEVLVPLIGQRAGVYFAATLSSLVDLRSACIRRGIVRPRRVSRRTPLGSPADWQRNQTEIGLRRSISSPEEIRNGSNRRASRSTSSFPGRVTSLAISHCRCVTLFGVFH